MCEPSGLGTLGLVHGSAPEPGCGGLLLDRPSVYHALFPKIQRVFTKERHPRSAMPERSHAALFHSTGRRWPDKHERRVWSVHLIQVKQFEAQIVSTLCPDRDNDFFKEIAQCFSVLRVTTSAENTVAECKVST
jgi:hypothetical protein